MNWLLRKRLHRFLRSSIWLGPTFGLLVAIALYLTTTSLDDYFHTQSAMSAESARSVISTLTSAMLSLIVFVLSSLLVVLQLASAQLSPRIIARVMALPGVQASLAIFTFTFAFSLGVLTRIDTHSPLISGRIAVWSSLVCLCAFFYLVDRLGKAMRPISIMTDVANEGADVVRAVYPHEAGTVSPSQAALPAVGTPSLMLRHGGRSGVLLAFDGAGLLALAQRADCLIRLVPQVGDFVVRGDVIFEVYGGGGAVTEAMLEQAVYLGAERTMDQDPGFAFRIIVDIANKALSPAINDPTTAVLALDQIHLLLRVVGLRYLDTGLMHDSEGRVRMVYSTPDWEDFVWLGLTEIRQFGATSIQVMRRMRALIEHLIDILPADRRGCLGKELSLLASAINRSFPDEEDRSLAVRSDFQGLGGSSIAARRPG